MAWDGVSGAPVEPISKPALNSPKSLYMISYIAIWWINSKVPEGSMNTSENNCVARESSRVIILKSRLSSTGHSVCTREVRDIFDRQTRIPSYLWQPMCSRVLQPWGRLNSTTVPVRNITFRTVPSLLKTISMTIPFMLHNIFRILHGLIMCPHIVHF